MKDDQHNLQEHRGQLGPGQLERLKPSAAALGRLVAISWPPNVLHDSTFFRHLFDEE